MSTQKHIVTSSEGKLGMKGKCERLLLGLSTQNAKKQGSVSKPYTIDTSASNLMRAYVTELTAAVIEESLNLAKHRKSKEISQDDVSLALVKKHSIDIGVRFKKTHMQAIRSLPITGRAKQVPTAQSTSTTTTNTAANSNVKNILASSSGNNVSQSKPKSQTLNLKDGAIDVTAIKTKRPSKRKTPDQASTSDSINIPAQKKLAADISIVPSNMLAPVSTSHPLPMPPPVYPQHISLPPTSQADSQIMSRMI